MVKDEGFAEAVVAIFDHLHLGDVVKDRLVLELSRENVTSRSGMRSISLDRGIDEASRGDRAAMAINAVLEEMDAVCRKDTAQLQRQLSLAGLMTANPAAPRGSCMP